MTNEIFAEKATGDVEIEIWTRVVGTTSMQQLAVMDVPCDEVVPEEEDDGGSRYWAKRIYDELDAQFGFSDE